MAPPARGLSPADLGSLREAVSAGRRPRVVFTESAGQIAGRVGEVVALADPATATEWITVRFDGDELPFAADDLALRGRRPGKQTKPATGAKPAGDGVVQPGPVHPERGRGSQPGNRAAAGTEPGSLVVTLRYAEREWTLAATQGGNPIVQRAAVRPADALRMVALVDAPALHDAVASIIAEEREQAEQHAHRLRAELAHIESRLAELGRPT